MHLDLNDSITSYFRTTPVQRTALKKMGIETIRDLLYHFPTRYGDTATARSIDSLQKGDTAVIFGKVHDLEASKGFRSKITMSTGIVEDETGKVQCVWFNQPYISKMYSDSTLVRIEGKVSERRSNRSLYFSNPKIERVTQLPQGVGDSLFGEEGEKHTLYPVYCESKGISSLWIYHALLKLFKNGVLDIVEETLPEEVLKKYNLPQIRTALIWIHTPQKRDDALSARKRFSFEEIFVIQLERMRSRKEYENFPAFKIESNPRETEEFIKRFPFQATEAQRKAIQTILVDLGGEKPMSRLLEGDVGSGKTAVAATATYAVFSKKQNMQVAYMCPTEILAMQHFESFIQYFAYLGIQVALITSSGCRKFPSKVNPKGWTDISRSQLLKWIENGEIPIVIGTHSLIEKSVKFKNLAFVIIDEQHRFGTYARSQLIKKESVNPNLTVKIAPHLLSMTATPIPRTLALTMYGDLDLTLLDQSPAGRKPVITEIVLPNHREEVYEKVRHELQEGRQAFVICPRIDEPDREKELAQIARSVKEEAKRLQEKVFPEFKVGILHGRLRPKEKDSVMNDFRTKKIDILCATSVVEVGVNIPNATVILIEGSERFGLAQLHQLRGRVLRSNFQAYCYAFTETTNTKSLERLRALKTAKNGFGLAEIDLSQRGSGELWGNKQWGVSDIAMEALKNMKMVTAARDEAKRLIDEDIDLIKYPILKREIDIRKKEIHFE